VHDVLIGVALLHGALMLAELLPWPNPMLLQLVSKTLPAADTFSETQRQLVATIVPHAGIDNGLLAGGLAWSVLGATPDDGAGLAKVSLLGAAVAGLFCTLTLKSPITAIQALAGVVGFVLLSNRGLG
jgi:uncharacterized membrane protein